MAWKAGVMQHGGGGEQAVGARAHADGVLVQRRPREHHRQHRRQHLNDAVVLRVKATRRRRCAAAAAAVRIGAPVDELNDGADAHL
eukprot:2222211-Prymnesium_polylepis.1